MQQNMHLFFKCFDKYFHIYRAPKQFIEDFNKLHSKFSNLLLFYLVTFSICTRMRINKTILMSIKMHLKKCCVRYFQISTAQSKSYWIVLNVRQFIFLIQLRYEIILISIFQNSKLYSYLSILSYSLKQLQALSCFLTLEISQTLGSSFRVSIMYINKYFLCLNLIPLYHLISP